MPLALGAPAIVIAGLFAVLFILGYKAFAPVIVRAVSVDIPYIGNVLGNLVGDALDATYVASLALLDNLVEPAINMLLGPIAAAEGAFEQIRTTLDVYAAAIVTFAEVDVPAALQAGLGLTGQQLDLIQYWAEGLIGVEFSQFELSTNTEILYYYHAAEADITALGQRVDSVAGEAAAAGLSATDVLNLATTAASSVVRTAEVAIDHQIQLAYDDATGYARWLVGGIEGEIATAVGTAEQFATTAIQQGLGVITTDIDNAITSSLAGIWTDVGVAIPELEGIIGTGDADILDALKRIDWTIPGTIAAVAALAGTTALTLTRYLKDCGIPNCQNLGQFGKDLSGLGQLVVDGSFLALITELAHNPSEGASIYADTFGGIVDGALSAARELLSV